MLKVLNLIFAITVLTVNFSGQTVRNTAPIKWQNYKTANPKLSILFPKLPILIEEAGYCKEFATQTYAVYADNSAYKMTVFFKMPNLKLANCKVVTKFNEALFEQKINTALTQNTDSTKTKTELNGKESVFITKKNGKIWFVEDLKNNRFIELDTSSNNIPNSNEDKFFKSLKFDLDSEGIEIGKGSEITLGDQEIIETNELQTNENDKGTTKETKTVPLTIAVRNSPRYTDEARKNSVQGVVSLKVMFQADGSVGDIAVVSVLPFGLTEQAIASAKKLVFLPQQVNGKNVTVIKTVQFSFSIY